MDSSQQFTLQNRSRTFRLRSYHPGNATSRPISAVKQDRALSSTVVGDHTETKGDVISFFDF